MINCKFINNTADEGGAVYWYGIFGTIANCEFINNSAGCGGAVFITGRNSKIDGSLFKNNKAEEDGGAICADGIDFVLSKSNLINNSADKGGALHSISYPTSIIESNFTLNNANDTAGAIYCSGDSCRINGSVFKNNSATVAGAVYGDVNDELSVYLSQFIGNSALEYGGAIYNTATAKFIMSIFSDNTGYDSKSNVDIYNKDGFVEDVVIYGTAHKIVENHPMASWRKDLIGGTIMIATAIITTNIGAAISATGLTLANFISMGVNAIVSGALGAFEGLVYAEDNQDYSRFWGDVLKGVSRGIQYSAFGNAFNGIKTITADKFIEFSLKQIYTKFIAKSVDLAQKIAADSATGNYNNIVFYSMFKNA